MGSRGDYSKALESLFRRKQVATLDDLRHRLGASSRTTILNALRRYGYFSSYSHAGKYYTLKHIPRFDTNGLWFYNEARFSLHETLRQTAIILVEKASAGQTHQELQILVGLRVHDTLRSLVEDKSIGRCEIAGIYVYVSAKSKVAQAQMSERLAQRATASSSKPFVSNVSPPPLDPARTIEVLVAVIHSPKDDARNIAARLVAQGVEISQLQVQQVFAKYDLGKKKARSRSRHSRS